MTGAFADLERRYGTVEGYLRDRGVGDEELDPRPRARLQ